MRKKMKIAMAVFVAMIVFISAESLAGIFHLVVDWEGRKIALTIDDVPCPETEKILDILHEEGVKATFFVVGVLAEKYPEIVKRMAAEGHEVENHTMTHPLWLSRDLTSDQVLGEIQKGSEVIERLSGIKTKFFRPPQGLVSDDILSASEEQGLKISLWSWGGDCRFWVPVADGRDPAESLFPVLLLHGGEELGKNDTEYALNNLQDLIKKSKTAGFTFVRLDEFNEEELP